MKEVEETTRLENHRLKIGDGAYKRHRADIGKRFFANEYLISATDVWTIVN